MQNAQQLLEYVHQGVDEILELETRTPDGKKGIGGLRGDLPLRFTQWEALLAYREFLDKSDLSAEQKLAGYFEIPTGVGKTAMFIGIAQAAQKHAQKDGKDLRTVIVAPTVNLLEQTRDEFLFFVPDMVENIGLYWSEEKDLTKPVTIMTYDAWIDLVEKGELSEENVDLLISDEGHRGTSDLRQDAIFEAFNGSTIRLAFTATATFDLEKSVANTHHNRIFSKTLTQAVRDDELADYIQTYFYVIRANPPSDELRDEFDLATGGKGRGLHYEARKSAWNEWAIRAYKEEKDNQTGDLLADNQAGFFVADIAHADRVKELLNTSAVLQRYALEQGREGVAVAVHSDMSQKQQAALLKAYQEGKYMAIVADEKIKEGFDHPPMKTVFDYPHGSLVDKIQILGRGARKWWNDSKQRYEGLTFLDTVVYVGSDDPKQDAKLRQEALKSAVLSLDILNETIVLAPGREKVGSTSAPEPTRFSLDNVEQYTTLEDVALFVKERETATTRGRISISEDMVVELQLEMERTGVGPKKLISQAESEVPEGISPGHIRWWSTGTILTATAEHWNWTMSEYSKWPTVQPRMRITDELRQKLQDETDRTSAGYKKVLTGVVDIPGGLRPNMIENWRSGNAKTANPDHWAWVMARYASLPTMSEKIEITDNMRVEMVSEIERTGVGVYGLIKQNTDVPFGLTPNIAYGWVKTSTNTAYKDYWDWAMGKYAELQNAHVFTDEDRAKLNAEMERTNLKGTGLIKVSKDVPIGLTSVMINLWAKGSLKTALQEHWHWTQERFAELPDNVKPGRRRSTPKAPAPEAGRRRSTPKAPAPEAEITMRTFIDVTDEMRAALITEVDRTGVAETKLINRSDDVPEGLTNYVISNWRNGASRTAEPDHWAWVMARFSDLPDTTKTNVLTEGMHARLEAEIARTRTGFGSLFTDDETVPEGLTYGVVKGWRQNRRTPLNPDHWSCVISKYEALPSRVELKHADKKHLKDELKRTGVGHGRLISTNTDVPEGLTASIISGWIGAGKKFPLEKHVDWVKSKYAALPDAPRKISFTDKMRSRLLAEIERTGTGGGKLVSLHDDVPEGLDGNVINRLQSPKPSKTVRSDFWDWLMSKYEVLPTAPKVEITDHMYEHLLDEMERTEVGSKKLLSISDDVPDGLTEEMISSWQSRSVKTVRQAHWDWTIAKYREQPDMFVISEQDRQLLVTEIERTGVTYNQIIAMHGDAPNGLTGLIIETWKDAHTKKTPVDRWEWTLSKYRELPDAPKRVEITEEMREKIISEKRRTGVGSAKLLSMSDNVPEGIRHTLIDSWIRDAQTLREADWQWVLSTYEALPTVSNKISLSDENVSALKAEFRRTGIGYQALFSKAVKPPPQGLTKGIVQSWWYGDTSTAYPEHYEWVVDSYSGLPDREDGPA